MIKKIFIFSLFLIILPAYASFDINTPVNGQTIADEILQFNTMNKIYKILSAKYPSCSDYSVIETQIVQFPRELKTKNEIFVHGYWKELWTINVCSTKIQVPIDFSIKKNRTEIYINKSLL